MTLPTFIVIGVAKAGTTSLYRYFDQHPDVFMYPEKGTNYFGYEDARDWKWADEGEPPLLRHFRVESFDEYEAAFAGSGAGVDEWGSQEPGDGDLAAPGVALRRDDLLRARVVGLLDPDKPGGNVDVARA